MSDRVVVMNQGHIEQFADPVTIYEKPATDFIAGFVGTMNRHPQLPNVRPENLTVTTAEEDTGASPRRVEAQVLGAHYIGGRYELRCDVPGAEEPWVTYSPHRFTRGETVYLNYPSSLSA